jgi:hypothetical protein
MHAPQKTVGVYERPVRRKWPWILAALLAIVAAIVAFFVALA